MLARVGSLGKQKDLISICYADYHWQQHENCVSLGVNKRFHSLNRGSSHLNICKPWLVKRLCSVDESFFHLRWKVKYQMMILVTEN